MPMQEISEHLQASLCALLRMELDRDDVIPRYGTGKGDAVVAARSTISRQCGFAVVTMYEVEARTRFDPGKDWMGA